MKGLGSLRADATILLPDTGLYDKAVHWPFISHHPLAAAPATA